MSGGHGWGGGSSIWVVHDSEDTVRRALTIQHGHGRVIVTGVVHGDRNAGAAVPTAPLVPTLGVSPAGSSPHPRATVKRGASPSTGGVHCPCRTPALVPASQLQHQGARGHPKRLVVRMQLHNHLRGLRAKDAGEARRGQAQPSVQSIPSALGQPWQLAPHSRLCRLQGCRGPQGALQPACHGVRMCDAKALHGGEDVVKSQRSIAWQPCRP